LIFAIRRGVVKDFLGKIDTTGKVCEGEKKGNGRASLQRPCAGSGRSVNYSASGNNRASGHPHAGLAQQRDEGKVKRVLTRS